MSKELFAKKERPKKDKSGRRWRVDYKDMTYDYGASSSWTDYHRSKAVAIIVAWWTKYIASWGGKVTLTDQHKEHAK